MRYSGVHVRPAQVGDAQSLATLAERSREHPTARSAAKPTAERYRAAIGDPGRRVVVAEDVDGQIIGMAVFTSESTGDLLDVPVLRIGSLLVAPEHRRRGAGRALLAASVTCADELGVEHVVAAASSQARDVHRYLARLGFAPLVIRRIASVSALRRTLGMADTGGEHTPQDRLRRRVIGGVMRAPRALTPRALAPLSSTARGTGSARRVGV